MKVIFLDIDGVLVTESSLRCGKKSGVKAKMDASCVAELNSLVATTGAKVVVSSTWRYGGLDFVGRRLAEEGVVADVIDITPRLQRQIGNIWLAATRGAEIGGWLLDHPEVKQFVILDDDDAMGALRNHHVQTDFEGGLTESLAVDARKILERIVQ